MIVFMIGRQYCFKVYSEGRVGRKTGGGINERIYGPQSEHFICDSSE